MQDFYSILIDKQGPIPIYQQLGDALCRLIEEGALAANSKLPPIRRMASALKINSDTVVSAYKYLENKKVVYSQVGSGTYVSPIPLKSIPEPVVAENISRVDSRMSFELTNAINFVNTSLPAEFFPVDEFKVSFNEVLDREKGNAFRYMGALGYPPLREAIAGYLEEQGILVNADQILIISGAQQGIDIVAKAMMTYSDVVFVEKPTFYGAAGAFLSRGGRVLEIELQKDGIDMDTLENYLKLYHPRFIYMMTYFQTPTGISYSIDKKRRILALAEKYDTYIIEDDNLFDFNYTNRKVVPLKALDYKNRVIYIKSFSKILMPGLRMGFMVLPKKILQNVMAAKYTTDISTSGFIQQAFDLYLRNYQWKNHIELVRGYAMAKYKLCMQTADKYLKSCCQYMKPEGGISLWVQLPAKISAAKLCSSLLGKGVIVAPGSQFYINGGESYHIRIVFSSVTDDKMETGIRQIGETIRELESWG